MGSKTTNSFESAYERARMAVLKHATTQTLVENGEFQVERWAEEFAEHRARYEKVLSILYPNAHSREFDARTQKALTEGDQFIKSQASSSWEGNWVDPQWRTAALEREKNDREERAVQVMEAQEVEFNYTRNELGRFATKQKAGGRIEPDKVKNFRRVMDSVELRKTPKPRGRIRMGSPLMIKTEPTASSSKKRMNGSAPVGPPSKRTRSQKSLKQRRVSTLGISARFSVSPPLTLKNSPECDVCIKCGTECFSSVTRMRCEACRKGRRACSLVSSKRAEKEKQQTSDIEGGESDDDTADARESSTFC
ncbi:hypothetical protein BDP27DRAFT_1317408 [Rhodocollybia butyracea]|uniref:Uncharacterized protein n=1 Tax=Rhodocollybia butyracea TaxID=206335 RepID=A0A9P5Q3X3_9AGAR|nr:hypothetical protein BDP27DRAFT_1317408 [Rhodocollybia butyracea]